MRRFATLVGVALALGGCARPSAPVSLASPTAAADLGFTDRVWRVAASSSVAQGTLYVFLSDGTLVITSPASTPMLGEWSQEDAQTNALVMVEQSIAYPVDIVALTADTFVIRSHNPGEPVEITLVPASPSPSGRRHGV